GHPAAARGRGAGGRPRRPAGRLPGAVQATRAGAECGLMVDAATIRRLAMALPEVVEASRGGDHMAFEVKGGKGLVWTFMRRIHAKKARFPDPEAVAIRCLIERREMLVAAAPDRFFDDDHYRGYPAVLVRLPAID